MTIAPLPRSSGDLLADRRADYAEMLFANGEHAAAAELMMGAMELAPGWALGWFRLGEFHEAAGAMPQAAQAYRMCLSLDPADRAGAALKLAVIGAAPMPAAPPSQFVEALFDEYAPGFDASLVEKLGYRVPELLAAAIAAFPPHPASTSLGHPFPVGERNPERFAPSHLIDGEPAGPGTPLLPSGEKVVAKRPDEGGNVRFRLALDLGCGTGLMGERLRAQVDELVGYDISSAMLKKAEAKKVYDRLEQVDLQKLDASGLKPDLVTAADVFMYVGNLDGVFAAVSAMLTPGGLFAFSVEAFDSEGFVLRDSRRYAHSENYVRGQLDKHGFALRSLDREAIRMDRNAPIEGLIVVATV